MRTLPIALLAVLLPIAATAQQPHDYDLRSTPATVAWGYYWSEAKPVLRIHSGDRVTVHGMITNSPAGLQRAGVDSTKIQQDLRDIYRDVKDRGPGGHILTGPIYVEGADSGDVLEVRFLSLHPDIDYAYNSFGTRSGFIPEDFTAGKTRIIPLDTIASIAHFAPGIDIPLHPFFGSVGVAPPAAMGRVNSAPPGIYAGNLDNKELVAGTTLYIPVFTAGALLEIGDGHAGMGNGEVDITAMETALRGTVQVIVRKDMHLKWPRAETATHWIAMGIDSNLVVATKTAVREAIDFLMTTQHLSHEDAYMLASVAVDFDITELVDGTVGVHAMIPKAIFHATGVAAVTGTIAGELFGQTTDGIDVERYTLTNSSGVELRVMTLGGVITHLRVPDRADALDNVVLGYDSLEGYLTKSPHFGAITGRFANRIAGGRFTIDGTTYQLELNKGGNTLHGGSKALDRVVWAAEPFTANDATGLTLRYVSPDGDQHFPGTLAITVSYRWTEENALIVDYHAVTDKPTPVNLTQHSYFNLAGAGNGDILGHVLTLHADHYTPVNAAVIPTGEIAPVAGTPFDFRSGHPIGERIDADNEQLRIGGGYDHNFVVNPGGKSVRPVAHVVEPGTGRVLDVASTEPGVQLYTGNGLDGSITGSGGKVYGRRGGFCLETQHFPDAPNHPGFPDTVLRPGTALHSRTTFIFSVED